MRFAAPRRPDPVVDLTPMIDVVFQLILFFMVSTTFVNAPGVQVDLPRAHSDELVVQDSDLHVWVPCGPTASGGCGEGPVYLGDERLTLEGLAYRFREAAARDPATLVVIEADRGVPHGWVVAVMDAARREGLTRLAIATEPAEDEGP